MRCDVGLPVFILARVQIEPNEIRCVGGPHIQHRVIVPLLTAFNPGNIVRTNPLEVGLALRKSHIAAVRIRHNLSDQTLHVGQAFTRRIDLPIIRIACKDQAFPRTIGFQHKHIQPDDRFRSLNRGLQIPRLQQGSVFKCRPQNMLR